MAKVKLELKNKTDAQLGPYGESIVTAMTDNANFTTPTPTLAAVTTKITAYEAALANVTTKQNAVSKAIVDRKKARIALEKVLTLLGGYVETTTEGDESKILSAGIQVRDEGAPVGLPSAPDSLSATAGDMEGEVDLVWQPVSGSRSYEADYKVHTDAGIWERVKTVTASKMTVEDLTPGEVYAFRVRAIGSAGAGPWSDEAVRRAP